MIITNKYNLPQAFVEMANQEYEIAPNEYRVTSLLQGMKQTMLTRRHHHQIEVDVADMVWMLFGTAVHDVLERQQEADTEIKEERLKAEIGGYVLSGKFDLYCGKTNTITDYKTCSVWKIIYGEYKDWKQQQLIYAYLLRQHGFPADHGRVIAFLKDHSKRDAKHKAGYPKLPVCEVGFDFSDSDHWSIESFLEEKFKEVDSLQNLSDDEIPECSPEERFNSGDKFAVMKKARKKAVRVLDSMEEAIAYMSKNNLDDKHYVEKREGEDKKCEDYCFANQFCNYYLSKKGA